MAHKDREAQRSQRLWAKNFMIFCLMAYIVPIYNFFDFLHLASRVLKVITSYADHLSSPESAPKRCGRHHQHLVARASHRRG